MTDSVKVQLIEQIEVSNTLGEGIQWHAERHELWWTDIANNQLFCYHWTSKALTTYSTPEAVCCFAFIESDGQHRQKSDQATSLQLLVAFASGIAYYTPSSQAIDWIKPNITDTLTQRLNDGRVDRQGRFWVGSMSRIENEYDSETGRGQLFCLDQNEELRIQEHNIHISNGTCWSPDSTAMYFADSPRREIYRYEFNPETGQNSWRQIFHKTPKGAFPDGACVDAAGFLWSAHWGAGKVVRYSPDGRVDAEINIPVTQPSCVTFGGENLDLLFVTTARQDLSDNELQQQAQAGHVFIFQTNVTGLPENIYQRSRPARRDL